ncbi:hypothetical protein BHE74_00049469 [Ensete ventricosum]|nr:hypothetical protein BHE74_00049469 [Ensete ventricosum]
MIKSIEESEEEVQEPEEENTKEDLHSANCTTHALAGHANPQAAKVEESPKQHPITVLIKTRSTNNFMNSKVAAQLMLQNEDCSRFDVEIADGQILKCSQRCPRVKLLQQDQEILVDFFLLPLDDYEVVLDIKWLTTLGDLVIAWDRRIAIHHRPVTTVNARPQEQDAPTIRATREPHELQIRTQRLGVGVGVGVGVVGSRSCFLELELELLGVGVLNRNPIRSYRYVDRPLPGRSAKNQLSAVDFDRR